MVCVQTEKVNVSWGQTWSWVGKGVFCVFVCVCEGVCIVCIWVRVCRAPPIRRQLKASLVDTMRMCETKRIVLYLSLFTSFAPSSCLSHSCSVSGFFIGSFAAFPQFVIFFLWSFPPSVCSDWLCHVHSYSLSLPLSFINYPILLYLYY